MVERSSVALAPARSGRRRGATLMLWLWLSLAAAGCGQKGALSHPPASGASGAASAPSR